MPATFDLGLNALPMMARGKIAFWPFPEAKTPRSQTVISSLNSAGEACKTPKDLFGTSFS